MANNIPFDPNDGSLYKILGIPEALWDVMTFAEVKFAAKNKVGMLTIAQWPLEKQADPQSWILTLPTNIPGVRVEIPINDPIDKDDPEGHWRVILGAAADFQSMVNSGAYKLDGPPA